jgi:hypothetical protein
MGKTYIQVKKNGQLNWDDIITKNIDKKNLAPKEYGVVSA